MWFKNFINFVAILKQNYVDNKRVSMQFCSIKMHYCAIDFAIIANQSERFFLRNVRPFTRRFFLYFNNIISLPSSTNSTSLTAQVITYFNTVQEENKVENKTG